MKWYEGYPEVEAINALIEEYPETCGMIAIGEDGAEDTWGEPWELDMYTVTTMEW